MTVEAALLSWMTVKLTAAAAVQDLCRLEEILNRRRF